MNDLKIEYVAIDSIKPYKNNAKKHPKEQIEQIKKSIEQFGMDDPIGVWKDEVVEGHGRLIACKELGFDKIPVIRLDHLSDEERKAYTLAHNKLTMNSDFDIDILEEELLALDIDMTQFGFDEIEEPEEEVEIIEDEIPDAPDEAVSKPGEIYQLGNHRLMCGDSTKREDVLKLVGDEKIQLLITDPPYNVDYEGGTKDKLKIQNDNQEEEEFHQFLLSAFTNAYEVLQDGASFYCWYASREVVNFHTAIEESGFTVKQELIWNKSSLVMGRQDYQWKHEPCLYGWKETDAHQWYGDRKQTTVIDWDKPTKCDLHPTMKPVGLFDYQIKNSSKKGDNVLDLFGGSGTTIIACEQDGRNGFMMEYDPIYVDVIIKRWENLTGKKAVKISD